MEEARAMPYGAVWNYYCLKMDVPPGDFWIEDVHRYETKVLNRRK